MSPDFPTEKPKLRASNSTSKLNSYIIRLFPNRRNLAKEIRTDCIRVAEIGGENVEVLWGRIIVRGSEDI
jgi:hypothetical protein